MCVSESEEDQHLQPSLYLRLHDYLFSTWPTKPKLEKTTEGKRRGKRNYLSDKNPKKGKREGGQ